MARAIDIVRKVAPGALKNYTLAFDQGDPLLKQCGIATPLRLAHFLAQVLHETGGLTIEWESGNYSAERLLEIFGVGHHSAAITPAEASQLARRPEAIFERVYGLGNPSKARELGNIDPGDGFKYRGGGILQTTGRGNYRRMGQKCGVDFETHPEFVISAEHALKPALAEWNESNLNAAADRDDIVTVTRRINGGLIGINERAGLLAKLKPLIQSVEFADVSPIVVPSTEPVKVDTGPVPSILHPEPAAAQSDLAHHIIAAMERKGYQIDRGQNEINIVYVEGINPDGTPNDHEENKWNDLRLLIRFEGDEPRIIGKWAATTEPGRYYIDHPLNPGGAARVELGQYRAWQVGIHRGDHEALVQTGGPVTVCRDTHRDGFRSTDDDVRQTGEFGINQHWGYDLPEVDRASAGCLVGQSKIGHREFMALVKTDPRFLADRKFVFISALLPEAEVLAGGAVAPGPQTPVPSDVREDVRRLQKLLGFSEQQQDGIFGAITNEAVKSAQRRLGLPVTGEVDDKLLDALTREAAGGLQTPVTPDKSVVVTPPTPDTPVVVTKSTLDRPVIPTPSTVDQPDRVPGGGGMNPLILLATRLLPDIARLIVGDTAGTLAGDVIKAVTDVTRTDDPKQAADKLNADPTAADALRLKLAQIAAAQEEKRQQAQLALLKEQSEQELKRQQAQLALLKEQNEQELKRRDADLAQFRAEIEDTKGARSTFAQLALANNPMAWGAPLVSLLVTIGFFGILFILIVGKNSFDNQVAQIVNITVGALAAAFATVVSFWLGSSQGSRAKDAATIQFQAEQVNQTVAQTEALKTTVQAQAKQAEALHATVKSAIAGAPAAAAAAKLSNFRRCLDIVLGYEGGYTEMPGDPNGATQFGLSLNTLRDWRQNQALAIDDLKKLGRDEACEIYRTRYWNVLRCDDLPTGVDLIVFDFGVDATASRSAKALQQAVGAEADGSVGDATLAATKTMPAADVVKELSNRRLDYYRSLSDATNSARAAINRTTAVEKSALDMIAADRTIAV